MLKVMTVGGGQAFAFPDVCKTPTPGGPVPIPYPNLAMCRDGKGTSKVRANGYAVLRKGDRIRQSTGDEAGQAGGVISNGIRGACEIRSGWSTVRVAGKEIAHHTSRTAGNGRSGFNQPAAAIHGTPSSTSVAVIPPLPAGGDPHDPVVDLADVIDCSPTLKDSIELLEQQFQTDIKYGPGGACMYHPDAKSITIGRALRVGVYPAARALAHEVGHGMTPKRARRSTAGRVAEGLSNEGAAVLFNADVRDEILANCGYDIGIHGFESPEANEFVKTVQRMGLEDKYKRMAIGKRVGRMRPSTDPHMTYREFYRKPPS